MRLGLFDSGVGGLSVLNALLGVEPELSALYLADTAWLPYGTKAPEDLSLRIAHIVKWLTPQVDAIVVACNTSAALIGDHWDTLTPLPVYDPISAAAQVFTQHPTLTILGIMATPNTVNSLAYPKAIHRLKPSVTIRQVACPGLADAVEQGVVNTSDIQYLLQQWVNLLNLRDSAHALILGCTHYPFALPWIQHNLSAGVKIIDPATAIAQHLNLLRSKQPHIQLVTTGEIGAFHQQVNNLPVHTRIKIAPVSSVVLPALPLSAMPKLQ